MGDKVRLNSRDRMSSSATLGRHQTNVLLRDSDTLGVEGETLSQLVPVENPMAELKVPELQHQEDYPHSPGRVLPEPDRSRFSKHKPSSNNFLAEITASVAAID